MRSSRILALAAVLTASVSAPALADFDRIGSVNISFQQDRDSASPDFGGPVERLQFTARGSDVACHNISVTLRNGRTMSVFTGTLRQNAARNVDLPGVSQDVRRINTNCHADRRGGASIDMAADIGRYKDTWRRSPDWSRSWAKMFNWADNAGRSADNAINYWVPISTLHFQGRRDSDATAGGWAGRSINSVGLKANTDAVCSGVAVMFTRGTRLKLGRAELRQGQMATFRLPSPDRTLSKLAASCHAVNGRNVDIQVYGNK